MLRIEGYRGNIGPVRAAPLSEEFVMRKEFEMSSEQIAAIMDACKPVLYIAVAGIAPRSPQENANDAWAKLGSEMGFDYMTVRPCGKGDRFFTADALP